MGIQRCRRTKSATNAATPFETQHEPDDTDHETTRGPRAGWRNFTQIQEGGNAQILAVFAGGVV